MLADSLDNDGIIKIGEDCGPNESTTIIVTGVGRSGTSMVAAALLELKVYMGSGLDSSVFEDVRLANALESDNVEELRTLIATNNQAHSTWGFKRPKAFAKVEKLVPELRNPRIVMTLRDPAAIAVRNSKSAYHDLWRGVHIAAKLTRAALAALDNVNCPVLLVSYEKAMTNRAAFLQRLAIFCGLQPTQARLSAAESVMQNGPALYLQNARIIYDGSFKIENGRLRGWIASNTAIPMCELCIGGEVIQTFKPGLRVDVAPRTGEGWLLKAAGFEVPLPEGMGEAFVRVQGSTFCLTPE